MSELRAEGEQPSPITFEELLAPVPVTEFAATYWDHRVLHVARDRPRHYAALPCDQLMQAALDAEQRDPGKTQRLSDIHLHGRSPPLHALCRMLGRVLAANVGVNMYFARAGDSGTGLHADTHDILVLQLHGRKRWRLFTGPELPLLAVPSLSFEAVGTDRMTRADFPAKDVSTCGDLIADVVLEQGDLLYAPRGVFHEVATVDDDSLHLTVGALPLTRLDWITAALGEAAKADVRFRRALPFGLLASGDADDAARAGLVEDAHALAEMLDPGAAITEVVDAYERFAARGGVRGAPPAPSAPRAGAAAPAIPVTLTPDTMLEVVSGAEVSLRREAQRALLTVNGVVVDLPGRVLPALRHVLQVKRFAPGELPGALDDEARLALAHRLLRAGLVRQVGAGA